MMGSSDSLNGLTFGKKIYFEYVGSGGGGGGGSSSKKGVADPPPPAKKGKWAVVQQQKQRQQQQQTPRCQVEGCRADLTDVKAYYCRHKVCGMHSKSPKVVVAGIEQRFCQQCSRFHQLNEFDQGKRSCRRRLAGHNERRRKPPPGILPPGYGRLSSSENSGFRGFLMDFTYPRPPVTPRAIWPTVTAGDRVTSSNQWQGSFSAPHGVTVAHPYMQPPAHFTAHELPFSESLAGVTDSSCALSLLSNQTWGSDASPRNRGPTISASSRLETGPTDQHTTTVPNNYMADIWGFKGHGTGNTSHQIQQDMEIRHFDNGHDRFSGELELALQGNNRQFQDHIPARSYDHSGRIMNWSL